MRSMVKVSVAVMFCMLMVVPSFGKLKVLLAVDAEDPSIRQDMITAISARLNSTDRYMVVESAGADLVFGVICVPAKNNGRVTGIACASHVEYYPLGGGLSRYLAGAETMILERPENLRSMADSLMDNLINETSDSKLLEYKTAMIASVRGTCVLNPPICRNP